MKIFVLVLANVILATKIVAQQYEPGQVIDGITIVNVACIESQEYASAAKCYMSDRHISMKPGEVISHSPVDVVIAANPGIEEFIVDGLLPPMHMIATRVTE